MCLYRKSFKNKPTLFTSVTTCPCLLDIKNIFQKRQLTFISLYCKPVLSLVLTWDPCSLVHICIPPSRGGRWHRWGIDTGAGSPCHSSQAHIDPHSAILGSRLCRHRLLWWGYIGPHSCTDSGCCSGAPSGHFHILKHRRRKNSFFIPAN